MDDISLIYNVNLCYICQNPENLDLFNTTTTNIKHEAYSKIVNPLFYDFVWIDDTSAPNLCRSCCAKLDSFTEFRALCLETNERRKRYILSRIEVSDDVIIKTEVKPELIILADFDKSHKCSSCSESFSRKVDLVRHEKKIHRSVLKDTKRTITTAKNNTTNTSKRRNITTKIVDDIKKEDLSDQELGGESAGGDDIDFPEEIDGEGNEPKITENDTPEEQESTPDLSYRPSPGETVCRICSHSFETTLRLYAHIRLLHANRFPYKCTICKQGFRYKDRLDRHVFRHTGSRNYICPTCGSTFKTVLDLRMHLLTHQDARRYVCEVCNKGFKVPSALRSHKLIMHTDASNYKWMCTECGSKFALKHSLTQHMLRHTNTKAHKCHICAKAFFTRTDLKGHLISHNDSRHHKCELCSAEFKTKFGLNKHKSRIHKIGNVAPIKKLPCRYCGRIITAGDKLRRHERTHTGEKPFKCKLCDATFICRSYIKGHLKGKHELDVDVDNFDQRVYYEIVEKKGDAPF